MHLPVMDIQFALFKIQPEIIQAELLSPSGNHDDGHIGLLPDLPQHLHAVDVRQYQIQQNQVRMIHAKKGICRTARHGRLPVPAGIYGQYTEKD